MNSEDLTFLESEGGSLKDQEMVVKHRNVHLIEVGIMEKICASLLRGRRLVGVEHMQFLLFRIIPIEIGSF